MLLCYCAFTGCDERHFEKVNVSVPIREPKYYWSPGPLKLSCLAFGDVQSIYWIRKQFDGGEVEIHNAKTSNGTTDTTSFLNSTIANYLLLDQFPYTYQCIALDKCCKRQKSKPRKAKLSPCRFKSGKRISIYRVSSNTSYLLAGRSVLQIYFPIVPEATRDRKTNSVSIKDWRSASLLLYFVN